MDGLRRRSAKPWTIAVFEFIEDGEWWDYDKIVIEVAPLVPEEIAFKKAEYYRQYHFQRLGKECPARKKGTRDDTIETGRRLMVGIAVQVLRKSGRLEVEYATPNGHKRRRPTRVRRLQ